MLIVIGIGKTLLHCVNPLKKVTPSINIISYCCLILKVGSFCFRHQVSSLLKGNIVLSFYVSCCSSGSFKLAKHRSTVSIQSIYLGKKLESSGYWESFNCCVVFGIVIRFMLLFLFMFFLVTSSFTKYSGKERSHSCHKPL